MASIQSYSLLVIPLKQTIMKNITEVLPLLPPVSRSKASAAASFSACFLLWQGCPIICIPLNSQMDRNWLSGSWEVR
ncbi:hypothetical protein HanPSC8_Chr12g0514711 [Helianthus annuus]|nr:hypothetical protein HanPSC8_Chr12g0514711 [Helianthus annuus]